MEIATLGVIFVNLKYVDLSEEQVSEFRLPPLSWAPALSILRMELPYSVDSNRVQLVQMIMEDIESLALDPPPLDILALVLDEAFQEAIEPAIEAIDPSFFIYFTNKRRLSLDFHFEMSYLLEKSRKTRAFKDWAMKPLEVGDARPREEDAVDIND
ncbi:hypothetical protein H0H93_012798 [Arthromyces matolae]|nr:hypothetical protein H0H93_012798 [Arthromyces matolae]